MYITAWTKDKDEHNREDNLDTKNVASNAKTVKSISTMDKKPREMEQVTINHKEQSYYHSNETR